MVHSYAEFTKRLIARFDRKDTKLYYQELAHIRQAGNVESFVNEFQRIAIMVSDMSRSRRVMLFHRGFARKAKGTSTSIQADNPQGGH